MDRWAGVIGDRCVHAGVNRGGNSDGQVNAN